MTGSRPKQDQRFKSNFNIPIARAVDCNWYRTGYRRPTRDGLACTCTHGCPMNFWAANGTPSSQRTCSTKNPIYRICVYDRMCPRVRSTNPHTDPEPIEPIEPCSCIINNISFDPPPSISLNPDPNITNGAIQIVNLNTNGGTLNRVYNIPVVLNCPAPEDIVISLASSPFTTSGSCGGFSPSITAPNIIIPKGSSMGTINITLNVEPNPISPGCDLNSNIIISVVPNRCISSSVYLSLTELLVIVSYGN